MTRIFEPGSPEQRAALAAFAAERFPDAPLAAAPIAAADEMLQVSLKRARDPAAAMRTYLTVGDNIRRAVLDILRIEGIEPSAVRSLLDFAGGYGRNLRFLRASFPEAALHTSDIDRAAVDFAASLCGATGLYSTLQARDFDCPRRFDLILVVSLFTHLRPPVFDEWLGRLIEMTEEGGRLIVTTHPIDKPRGPFEWEEVVPDAFYFAEVSEAAGRLASDYYGGSLVSRDYVARLAERHGAEVRRVLPGKISDHDVHVIARTPRAD